MKKRRLKHCVDVFCQMFCGWRLANSYGDLVALGSGLLVIDAKQGDCTFNGQTIVPLSIAGEIHAWLVDDLHAHRIPLSVIASASLTVQMVLEPISAKQRSTVVQHIRPDGMPIKSGIFQRLTVSCEGCIVVEGFRYEASLSDVIEWPASSI